MKDDRSSSDDRRRVGQVRVNTWHWHTAPDPSDRDPRDLVTDDDTVRVLWDVSVRLGHVQTGVFT